MPNNRQVMDACIAAKTHPKLQELLLGINSDIHAMRQHMTAMATMMNNVADVMGQQQQIMVFMKPYVEKLRQMGLEVGSDPTITGEVDEDQH